VGGPQRSSSGGFHHSTHIKLSETTEMKSAAKDILTSLITVDPQEYGFKTAQQLEDQLFELAKTIYVSSKGQQGLDRQRKLMYQFVVGWRDMGKCCRKHLDSDNMWFNLVDSFTWLCGRIAFAKPTEEDKLKSKQKQKQKQKPVNKNKELCLNPLTRMAWRAAHAAQLKEGKPALGQPVPVSQRILDPFATGLNVCPSCFVRALNVDRKTVDRDMGVISRAPPPTSFFRHHTPRRSHWPTQAPGRRAAVGRSDR
jgi:hypothetical protein